MAKLRLHMRIIVPPTILAQAAFIFVFRPTGAVLACTVLLPLIFDAFTAVLGLMANLRHPDFNWITETQAVKSGASVMIAMFGSWGAVILPGAAVLIFSGSVPAWIILSVYTAAAALLTWLMYRWIMTRGATIYSEL
jgi:ABC-2 type transport system permease protein